jgi:hypothetical protein
MIDFAPVAPTSRPSLGDEIARLSAHIEAATGRLLAMIREFDASEEWIEEGFTSCAAWLGWRTHIGPGAARERVRVAKALGELPLMDAALCAGRLSYSVARALTRIATPDNEAMLLETARHTPAADLERLVSAWQRADRAEALERADEQERHARRRLWLMPQPDGSWRLIADLDPEVGARLQKALEAAEQEQYGIEADPDTPLDARRADAIGRVAEAALGDGLRASSQTSGRFQVVMHVSAETPECDTCDTSSHDERARIEPPRIEHGPYVSAETARRLACDASVVVMTHDREGNVLDVGRKRRTPPPALRRALDHRDRVCRFPGCRNRFCESHHVRHWTRGGETKLGNLLLFCRRHHRRFHEGGWTIELDESGEARFYRPDGSLMPPVPEAPALPDEPLRALAGSHDALGIAIDAWTATPDWEGDRLDTDWALSTLR